MSRMCGEKGESVSHLTSECSKLAQREYKRQHDNVAWYEHWQLCGKEELEWADQWYKHTPQQVVENTGFKVLWDFNVQCDRMVEARRPDIIFIDKQAREAKIIVITMPGDAQVKDKELEKKEKYQFPQEEIGKLWKLKKVTVVPIVIGTLGPVSNMLGKYTGKLNVTIRIEVIQKAAVLGTAGLLWKVLATQGLQCKDFFGTSKNLLLLAPKGNILDNENLLSLRFHNVIIKVNNNNTLNIVSPYGAFQGQ